MCLEGKFREVELLGRKVHTYVLLDTVVLLDTIELPSKKIVLIFIPTNNTWEGQFPHSLRNRMLHFLIFTNLVC